MSIQVSGLRAATSCGMSPNMVSALDRDPPESELLAPESTAVQTFTQTVTVNLTYGQLLYLENALLVAKP